MLLPFLPGRGDNEKMRQMEEKIQTLTKNLQDLQSTLNTMKEQFQQEVNKPGFTGGGGGGTSSGGRNPADAAQPEIKETIHSIQTKLDQLDNRTQVNRCFLLDLGVFEGCGQKLMQFIYWNTYAMDKNERHPDFRSSICFIFPLS